MSARRAHPRVLPVAWVRSGTAPAPGATPLSDSSALLVKARRDPDAFAALFRAEYRQLCRWVYHRVLCPHVAADLAAESFAVAMRRAADFDPELGDAAGWLRGIAHNQIRNWARRGRVAERNRRRLGIYTPSLSEIDVAAIEEATDNRALMAVVRTALGELAVGDRELITMRVLDQTAYEVIADRHGCTVAAARVRVSRALARLRRQIDRVQQLEGGLA